MATESSPPQAPLGNDKEKLTSPTVFPAFVRRTRLRRGASVFVRRGRLMSAVIARPRRNKRRRNNASPPDGLSPTAHAQSPLQPAEPSPPPVKSETRTKEGWEKCRARTLSPPRVARVTVAKVGVVWNFPMKPMSLFAVAAYVYDCAGGATPSGANENGETTCQCPAAMVYVDGECVEGTAENKCKAKGWEVTENNSGQKFCGVNVVNGLVGLSSGGGSVFLRAAC